MSEETQEDLKAESEEVSQLPDASDTLYKHRAIVHLTFEEIASILNLPEGYYVFGLNYSFEYDALQVAVCSHNLPEVAENSQAPLLLAEKQYVYDEERNVVGVKIELGKP